MLPDPTHQDQPARRSGSRSPRRPSAPLLVSVAALVVALGGTSYAASQIRTADLQDDAVISKKIKNGTVGSVDLKDGSIKLRDLASGPRAGITGPQGEPGPAGMDGVGRWALVEADGTISAQSGGFSVVAAYPTLPSTVAPPADNSLRANGNVYIDAGTPLGESGIVATIALQNTVDLDGDGVTTGRAPGADANPEFSGEVAVSRCSFPGATGIPTNCAPAGAQNERSLVVSPRNSDGSPTVDGERKRFYVVLTGGAG